MHVRKPFLISLTAALLWFSPHACGCLIGLCLDGCGCQSPPQTDVAPDSCCSVPAAAADGCECGAKRLVSGHESLLAPSFLSVRPASPSVLWTLNADFPVFRLSENAGAGFPKFGKPPNDPELPFLQMWRC